jgi:ATP-dependent Clp protease ATP-binding subunit ClpX
MEGVMTALFDKLDPRNLAKKHVRCSFCGRDKDAVANLISGPGVYICDQCVERCNEILAHEGLPR